ncbi:MAG: saccharopine dehydrogenase NADP-binding domain-containing protein, partial [Stellaceae bacterium]
MSEKKYLGFDHRMVMVGFGSIGQGALPLLLRHIEMAPSQVTIVTAEDRGGDEARSLGVRLVVAPLTRANYRAVLEPLLGPGDVLVNVSVDVSSVALIELCISKNVLYLDTCIEPWPGFYTDPAVPPSLRSNYALRESALKVRESHRDAPTAVITHGANPGLVSHFVKQALIDVAGGGAVPE